MRTRIVVFAVGSALLAGLGLLSFNLFEPEQPLPIRTYEEQSESGIPPFPVVERAARAVRDLDGDDAMIRFLTGHIGRFPDDVNNGYFLTVIGEMYQRRDAPQLARQYYRRALFSFPDATVREVRVHRVAINRLLEIESSAEERIFYLQYLRRRYPSAIDHGLTAYYLAKAFETEGRWRTAYDHYREFLTYPDTRIPGEPEAYEKVARRLAFYDSGRDWTYRDLETLVGDIKNALWRQDASMLLRYKADENFFTMSWEQEQDDANSDIPTFDLAAFLRRSRVRFAEELDISSNANEAFLRTWGWSHRISTWYLYFRRIDFPADPEIHGNWEWAGIYFGESM